MITNRWRAFFAVLIAAFAGTLFATLRASVAHARTDLVVGMTIKYEEYESTWARYQGYHIDSVRVFASNGQGLPSWNDGRIQFLKQKRATPFISWKDVVSTSTFVNWLNAKPDDIPMVYLAHCHECEADLDAATYKQRQVNYWNALNTLPAAKRAQFKFGPIQTKQWTENTAGRSYATYDPGVGDFWGVDAYVNTWHLDDPQQNGGLGYPEHTAWMAKIDAYNTGGRPKWIPELGVVSAYYDDTDQRRALWINRVMEYIEARPQYKLVLWWNTMGTPGSGLPYYGTVRDFRLHAHRECNSAGQNCVTTQVAHSQVQWKLIQNRNGWQS